MCKATTATRSRLAGALFGLLGSGVTLVAAGAEAAWPRFHGVRGDNVSAETGLLAAWPEAGPALVWTATGIGKGYASVTVADGAVYTAGDVEAANVVTALDLEGKVRWRFENGAAWRASTPGARGTPVVDGDRVYHENAHGSVVCLDARTGQRLWGHDLAAEFGGRPSGWGYAESVAVDGARVIVCPGGATAMVALDKQTGQTVWKSPSADEPAGYATPVLAEHQGLRLLLTMSERSLIGVNADTGDLLWRFEHYTPNFVANCVSPIYHAGRVFVTGGYGKGSVLLAITVAGAKATVAPVWRCADLDNRHGGVVLLDGFLYGASHQGRKGEWCCLDWESGRLLYAAPGVGEGALTAAAGRLYILSERGRVGLVRAAATGHEVVSQFSLPGGGADAWAHPVVCGGRLYLRRGDCLYAYDVGAK